MEHLGPKQAPPIEATPSGTHATLTFMVFALHRAMTGANDNGNDNGNGNDNDNGNDGNDVRIRTYIRIQKVSQAN